MVYKLQSLKGKTKLKVYENIIICYDEMNYKNFQFEQDTFVIKAQGISKIYYKDAFVDVYSFKSILLNLT